VIGLYVLLVSGLSILLKSKESFLVSIVSTGVIAVLFQPLHGWLQRVVNRLFYGKRAEPYQVLAQLGSRLVTTQGSDDLLMVIITTIRETLNLPYIAILLDTQAEPLASGIRNAEPFHMPIHYRGVLVGQLLACPRSGEADLGSADKRLLDDFARQAGITIHAVQLAQDLQRSREEIVTAREEERRRLRRDLHDGLGPALATISMQSETARGLLRDRPAEADELLGELTNQAQVTMQEVRRLIHALRPPVLDDLGLVPALNMLTATFSQSGTAVTLQADDCLPDIPEAYEVAIYRITQEALNNVTKHAQARRCTICLTCQDGICLTIADDGLGIQADRASGIGLQSMRELAEQLGGSLSITTNEGQGTLITARLPLRRQDGADSNPDRG
jgi:signal transduction histidine kinase